MPSAGSPWKYDQILLVCVVFIFFDSLYSLGLSNWTTWIYLGKTMPVCLSEDRLSFKCVHPFSLIMLAAVWSTKATWKWFALSAEQLLPHQLRAHWTVLPFECLMTERASGRSVFWVWFFCPTPGFSGSITQKKKETLGLSFSKGAFIV